MARRIGKLLEFFGSRENMASISLGLALLLAGAAERAGLALIIGAYIMGLSLSRTDCADELRKRLEPIYHTLVSVFFCVLGMMVDVGQLVQVFWVGLGFAVFAAAAKIAGCALPALMAGFNWRGALRIGTGMMPRGEVTLIMAGIGLSLNFISQDIFGVTVMMTLLCTAAAPLLMVRLFNRESGLQEKRRKDEEEKIAPLSLQLPNEELAEFLLGQVLKMFEQEECYVHQLTTGEPVYHIRKDDIGITAKREGSRVQLVSSIRDREYARLMLLEALADLTQLFEGLRKIESPGSLREQLL